MVAGVLGQGFDRIDFRNRFRYLTVGMRMGGFILVVELHFGKLDEDKIFVRFFLCS